MYLSFLKEQREGIFLSLFVKITIVNKLIFSENHDEGGYLFWIIIAPVSPSDLTQNYAITLCNQRLVL